MEQSKQAENRHASAAKENQVGSGEQVTPDLLEKLARRLDRELPDNEAVIDFEAFVLRVLREVHLDELLEAGQRPLHESNCPGGVFSGQKCTCGKAEYDAAKKAFEESLE